MGNSLTFRVVVEYNVKIVYPLLVQAYLHLNPMKAVAEFVVFENDDNFFGQNISNDDAIMSTMRNELHLFHELSVGPMEIKNHLRWWANHVM